MTCHEARTQTHFKPSILPSQVISDLTETQSGGGRFALVLVQPDLYRMFKTVCTFDMILHFQSHPNPVCGFYVSVA